MRLFLLMTNFDMLVHMFHYFLRILVKTDFDVSMYLIKYVKGYSNKKTMQIHFLCSPILSKVQKFLGNE